MAECCHLPSERRRAAHGASLTLAHVHDAGTDAAPSDLCGLNSNRLNVQLIAVRRIGTRHETVLGPIAGRSDAQPLYRVLRVGHYVLFERIERRVRGAAAASLKRWHELPSTAAKRARVARARRCPSNAPPV